MRTFDAGRIYEHMNQAHGGIFERENAPAVNVNLNEQFEVLQQAERLRRVREQYDQIRPRNEPLIDRARERQQQEREDLERRRRIEERTELRAQEADRQRREDIARRVQEIRRAQEARQAEEARRREDGRWCLIM
jgi:colicin import membrane protein